MSPALLADRFQTVFGHPPTILATAPGRVNLIGEHTDYNDGFVFPAAIDRGLVIAASVASGPSRVISEELGDGEAFDTAQSLAPASANWSKYPAGMAWVLQQAGHRVPNLNVLLSSNIPIGSGVSSSAAIEMAFGTVWNAIGNLGISNFDLALLGQRCENEFLALKSGIMDQMASAMGRPGQAMFLDTRTLEIAYAPIPERLALVLLDTRTPRALTESAYNERRSQCEAAAAALGVRALRDATLPQLVDRETDLDPLVFRRARHVITENARAIAFRLALDAGKSDELGQLMKASHESLRDDYEVSCRELDVMAESAWSAPGCVGARMMGAGFGGACIALVEVSEVEAFKAAVLTRYVAATGRSGEAMVCDAAAGAHVI